MTTPTILMSMTTMSTLRNPHREKGKGEQQVEKEKTGERGVRGVRGKEGKTGKGTLREGTGMDDLERGLASKKTGRQKKLSLKQKSKQLRKKKGKKNRTQKRKLKRKIKRKKEKQRKRQTRNPLMLRKTLERR